jgi:hypothetical protein
MMDWKTIIPAVIGGLIVIIGWAVSHYLNKSRDIAAEKRKLRTTFLLEAYRRLERVAERKTSQKPSAIEDIESAMADIQLLGTPKQVLLAHNFAMDLVNEKNASLNELLSNLRDSLRNELDLEVVDIELKFLRIKS